MEYIYEKENSCAFAGGFADCIAGSFHIRYLFGGDANGAVPAKAYCTHRSNGASGYRPTDHRATWDRTSRNGATDRATDGTTDGTETHRAEAYGAVVNALRPEW